MKNDLPLIYIGAPYTAHSIERRKLNVGAARHLGCLVAEVGCSPLMPTVNSADFDEYSTQNSPDFWYEATAAQLTKCDAVIFAQGWHKSTGCKMEMKQAQEMGIPIFLDIRSLEEWREHERQERL